MAKTSRGAVGVDLGVKVLDQAARVDAEQRLLAADRAGVGEVDRDLHGGARGASHRDRVHDRDGAILDDEIDHVGVAHACRGGHGGLVGGGKRVGGAVGERACGVGRRLERQDRARREVSVALGLRAVGADAGGRAGAAVDELDLPRAALTGAEGERHPLHHEPEPRILRCTFGLSQNSRRGRAPCPCHRPCGECDLFFGRLGPGLPGFLLVERERGGHERAERRRTGVGVAAQMVAGEGLELLGIDPVDPLAEARDRACEVAQRRRLSDGSRELRDAVRRGAEVQDCGRPAPRAFLGARPKHEERAWRDDERQRRQRPAVCERVDALEGERDPLRNRQVEGGEPRERRRPPPIGGRTDRGPGIEPDDGILRVADDLLGLHCGAT